jgi:hypothetical protein
LESVLRVLRQRTVNHAIDSGDRGRTCQRGRLFVDERVQHAYRCRTVERWPAGEHLVEHRADGEQIRSSVHRIARRVLRRHVARRAEYHSIAGERQQRALRLFDGHARNAEVEQLRAVPGQEDVRGFQVAMQHAAAMQRTQGIEDLEGSFDRTAQWQCPARDPRGERLALEQLHRDEELALVFADFVQLTDVGMADARRRARFAPQPLARFVVGNFGAHGFERHRAAKPRILGGIHDAHATLAQLVQDFVRPKMIAHQI